jgi:hypothetical protein
MNPNNDFFIFVTKSPKHRGFAVKNKENPRNEKISHFGTLKMMFKRKFNLQVGVDEMQKVMKV